MSNTTSDDNRWSGRRFGTFAVLAAAPTIGIGAALLYGSFAPHLGCEAAVAWALSAAGAWWISGRVRRDATEDAT